MTPQNHPSIAALMTELKPEEWEQLTMQYFEQECHYPGGSYCNRQIEVSGPRGTERFDAEMTIRRPLTTATEIRRYVL